MADRSIPTSNAEDIYPISTTTVRARASLTAHTDEIWKIQWSTTGAYLASAGKDGKAIIWKVQPETYDFTVFHVLSGHAFATSCLAWSTDESLLITTTEHILKIWNVESGACIMTVDDAHQEPISSVQWLPSGGFITSSLDKKVIFWTAEGKVERVWDKGQHRIMDMAIVPGLNRLVILEMESAPPYSLVSYDLASMEPIFPYIVQSCLKSNQFVYECRRKGGRPWLIRHQLVHLCDLQNGRTIKIYHGHRQNRHIVSSTFGGLNNEYTLSGSEDGRVYIWDSATASLLHSISGHGAGTVNAVAWEPGSHDSFASCSDDGTIRIWQLVDIAGEQEPKTVEEPDSWVLL